MLAHYFDEELGRRDLIAGKGVDAAGSIIGSRPVSFKNLSVQ
jgi:hypothetical protein